MNGFGLGPVFWCEWRRVSRQWWFYALRSLLVCGLWLGFCVVGLLTASRLNQAQVGDQARVGEWMFGVVVAGQLSIVLLAGPASAAGAFCTELARGHVRLMLVSGMRSNEIVFGTLCARLLPLLGAVACVLPVLALASSLGGVPPELLLRLELVTLGSAALGSALALALSLAVRRLHETLVATYALLLGWVLGYPILFMIQMTAVGRLIPAGLTGRALDANPFWLALDPVLSRRPYEPGEAWTYLAGTIALALAITALAAWRLRPALLTDRTHSTRRSWRWRIPLARSLVRLDTQPIFWRECRAHQPSWWLRLLWGSYVVGAVLFTFLGVAEFVLGGPRRAFWAGPFNGFQAAVGLGLLSLVSPAVLAEERARGSLDVLLSTPISTADLVLGKWCACYRIVLAMAVLPAVLAFAHAMPHQRWIGVALVAGTVLAHGAAVTSLGLALATWVARIDRALILSATASVLMTVGWIPLVALVFQGGALTLGLAMGSPFLGVALVTSEMPRASAREWPRSVGCSLAWIVVETAIALSLLLATLATFDRCLGRGATREGDGAWRARRRRPIAPPGPSASSQGSQHGGNAVLVESALCDSQRHVIES
jgi:ABC-type transport system involved in multi-copper enzyme maturation permease subunit